MRRQNENIDFSIRTILSAGLFLIVLFIFSNKDCNTVSSDNSSAATEQVSAADNPVLLNEPLAFPRYKDSLVSCDLFNFNNSGKRTNVITCSNNKTDHLFLLCKERFKEIKPQITNHNPTHIRTSLINENIPVVS
jgi:hypothetical protein